MEKIKNFISWLIKKNLGRYVLGAIFLLIGGLIARWVDEQIGAYVYYTGAIIMLCQFIYHIGYAIYYNLIKKK